MTGMGGLRPPATVVVLRAPIPGASLRQLCERVQAALVQSEAYVVAIDVDSALTPDAAIVDALARLQLTALRAGGRVYLRAGSEDLRRLLHLTGLADLLTPAPGSVGLDGQSEPREQSRVEEVVDMGDPSG